MAGITRRAAAAGLAAAGCAPAGRVPAQTGDGPGLRVLARARGAVFGTAIRAVQLREDAALRALVAREAELLVPEWETKWDTLQPQEGRFDFSGLQDIVNHAAAANQRLRGHTLVWHEAMPPWLAPALAEGPARAQRLLEEHCRVVLGTTVTVIRDWDVVNEPIANPPGADHPAPGPGDLRDTPWRRALGPDYVELALRIARQQDCTLRLTVNDYGVEADTPWAADKRARLLRLCRRLLERGAPLDAIGIQAHLQMRHPFRAEPFIAFLQELRGMGLALAVTEMDVREPDALAPTLEARDEAVAAFTETFLRAALEGGVRSFLVWGLSDRDSWLVSMPGVRRWDGVATRGHPFDEQLRPKPMRAAFARAFG